MLLVLLKKKFFFNISTNSLMHFLDTSIPQMILMKCVAEMMLRDLGD